MSITTLSDNELFVLIAKDDKRALEVIYNRYSPILFSIIQKVVNDTKTSERLLADVFIIIWKNVPGLDLENFSPFVWLITLVRNFSVDFVRRYRSEEYNKIPYGDEYERTFIIPLSGKFHNRIDLPKAMELKERVFIAINDLTEAQGHVLLLGMYGGLTNEEIAEMLNIPLDAVKSKIKIALENLCENFNKETGN
ncbi:MAG: RNA polymerase sigma factor [Ignavibacteriaceae bacterium]